MLEDIIVKGARPASSGTLATPCPSSLDGRVKDLNLILLKFQYNNNGYITVCDNGYNKTQTQWWNISAVRGQEDTPSSQSHQGPRLEGRLSHSLGHCHHLHIKSGCVCVQVPAGRKWSKVWRRPAHCLLAWVSVERVISP